MACFFWGSFCPIDPYIFFVPFSQDAEEDPAKMIANGEAPKDMREESWQQQQQQQQPQPNSWVSMNDGLFSWEPKLPPPPPPKPTPPKK